MKAILDGKTVDVIIIDPPAAYAVENGLMEGVGVGEGEFHPQGEVYICYNGLDEGPEVEQGYLEVCAIVHDQDPDFEMQELSELLDQAFLIYSKSRYQIVKMGENEWAMKFIDPEQLENVYELTEDDRLVKVDGEGEEESVEERRAHYQDFILPIPPPPKKCSDELYLTMAYEPYDQIEKGEKTTEFRDYTESYVKKILSHKIKTVRFQRGYGGPGHAAPKQMVWTVAKVSLYESITRTDCDPNNIPKGMLPDLIAIDLGKRVE